MRRVLTIVVLVGVAVTTWASTAPAGTGSITTRKDPDDSNNVLDIRRVLTDTTRRKVLAGVVTDDPFTSGDITFPDDFIVFYLDTRKRGAADKDLYLGWDPNDARFECDLFNDGGGLKGQRAASTPDTRSIACVFPRKWLEETKVTKFGVESYQNQLFIDRAPNDGRYIGL